MGDTYQDEEKNGWQIMGRRPYVREFRQRRLGRADWIGLTRLYRYAD